MSNATAKRSQMMPLARSVRAYVAPVGRPSGSIVAFDPATAAQFNVDAPPAPWLPLGNVENFQRTAATKYEALRNGPVGNITVQYRTQPEARVEFDLPAWGKLQMALTGGTQMMNVLAEMPLAEPQSSGGDAIPASPLQSGSIDTSLMLTPDQLAMYKVGDIVAVDADYGGQTGYIGAGAPAAYLTSPLSVGHTSGLCPARHLQYLDRRGHNAVGADPVTTADCESGSAGHGSAAGHGLRGPRGQQLLPGMVGIVPSSLPIVAGARASTIRDCRWQPADARRGRSLRRRCSATCCTPRCTPCPPPIPTTARRCCAIAATCWRSARRSSRRHLPVPSCQ